jgi:stage II sporulation protein D
MRRFGTALARLVLGLALAALATTAAAQESPGGTIRVAIVDQARAVELRSAQLRVRLAGCGACRPHVATDVVKAVARSGAVEVDGKSFATGVRIDAETPVRLNGREYVGALEILKAGDALVVVNELPLEDYLAGVLRAEASERWPLEMLRAQAIASRTYAAYHRQLNASKPFHVLASTAHQQFFGRVPPGSPIHEAVRSTAGQVMRIDGELFAAFYHTESGGVTEDPRAVFASRNLPPFHPVRCAYVTDSPHYHWQLEVPLAELADLLRRAGAPVGDVTSVDVAERTETLRALTVVVQGSDDVARMRGNDFRRAVGYDRLKSTLFAVTMAGDRVQFTGRGYGHGVGMCQWCARRMAEHGQSADDILALFYAGAVLSVLAR